MTQDPANPNAIDTLLTLATTAPEPAECATCRDGLDDYIQAQLKGRAYTTLYPRMARHLDHCVDCAEDYAALYELALAEQTDALVMPTGQYQPDLSFLSGGPSLADRLRTALDAGAQRLSLQLDALILPLLRPPAAALAVRSDPGDRFSEKLLGLSPDEHPGLEEFPFGLNAYRDAQQPDHCLLEVIAQPPDRAWPNLAGMTVQLAGIEPVRKAETDAWGLAVFEDLPIDALPGLRIELIQGEGDRG